MTNQNKSLSSNGINLVVDASNGVGSIALRHLFAKHDTIYNINNGVSCDENDNITTNAVMIDK